MKTNRSVLRKPVYEIKLHSANMKISRTSLCETQFIAGLTSETLRVKLIGRGHRHRDAAQTKVKLREVFEIVKSFEATTFANQLMRTARSTQ